MKIIVISDTHGSLIKAKNIIRLNDDASLIIHLGDNFDDALSLQAKFPEKNFEYVAGNCDFATRDTSEKVIEVEGVKIFLTHGHRYSVKSSLIPLENRCRELDAKIGLFGHTHMPKLVWKNSILLLNPGSTSEPRGIDKTTFGIITIENGKINGDIKE